MASVQQEFELSLRSGADLLQRVYPNGGAGGVVLDGLPPLGLELGAAVTLNIHLQLPAERSFRIRGQLAWVRHKASATLKEAFGVDFSEADAVACERLMRFAQEQLPPEASRHEPRFMIDLPVEVKVGDTAHAESLCDLSLGGAFIRSGVLPAVGTTVSLRFRPPLSLTSVELEGRVVWVRRGQEPKGIGVAFAYPDGAAQSRVAKLVERLKKRQRGR